MDLVDFFLDTCRNNPDATAAVDEGGELTYGDYGRKARRLATLVWLKTRWRNVGIMLPTCKEFGIAYFASLIAGRTPVPLNFLLSRSDLEFIVRDAALDLILTVRFFEKTVEGLAKKVVFLEDLQGRRGLPLPWRKRWKPGDIATILYTSGTTAQPKGVMLTHRNFVSNLESCIKHVYFDSRDIILGVLPMFHSFALTTSLLLPVRIGVKAVYMRRFSAAPALKAIAEHKVTAMLAIPSIYRVLVRAAQQGDYDTSSLRLCVAGGEPLAPELSASFRETFNLPLLEGYGLTETSPVVCVNQPDAYKPGTAGRPLPGVEVKVVDDEGKELPRGSAGELWIRGESVMKGYYNQPELTAEVLTRDGWFKSGDLAVISEDGFVSITGRKKELIISSGENISPGEIEAVIAEHPKVFEVAVVPAPDPVRGEVPKAVVALNKGESCTEDEIKEFCSGKLPRYKIPRYVEFRPELPHGPTGKVLKRGL